MATVETKGTRTIGHIRPFEDRSELPRLGIHERQVYDDELEAGPRAIRSETADLIVEKYLKNIATDDLPRHYGTHCNAMSFGFCPSVPFMRLPDCRN